MISKRVMLSDGIWLNYLQTDRFKTGCFSVNLLQPLDAKCASINALIPSVLMRGCESYPDMRKISDKLDMLYGAGIGTLIRKMGEVQSVGLYADFLEDRYAGNEPIFAQVMEFMRQLLLEPCLENGGFKEEYVSNEKQNLINTITAQINDKRSYAVYRLHKHMFEGEAFAVSRLGDVESLDGADGAKLYAHWMDLLCTSPVEFFYLGQHGLDEVQTQMQKFVDRMPERTKLREMGTQIILPQRAVRVAEEAMDVTQGKLVLGFRTPICATDSRYPALMLLNTVFGAGMTSKLFMKIREEMSLCYYASSSLDRLKGVMIVSSGIEFEKYEVARDGILTQLDACKTGEITMDELESARSYLISRLRAYNDSPGQLDDFMVQQAVIGEATTVQDLIERLRNVTMNQVIDAANTLVLDTIYFLKGGGQE